MNPTNSFRANLTYNDLIPDSLYEIVKRFTNSRDLYAFALINKEHSRVVKNNIAALQSIFSKQVREITKDGYTRLYFVLPNNKKHGKYEKRYPDGQKFSLMNFKNGKLDGKCEIWHPNGQISELSNYVNGELEGKYKTYYYSGQKCERIKYYNGYICGIKTRYNESGNILYQRDYGEP